MFSVFLPVHGGGGGGANHVTITYDALDLTVHPRSIPSRHQTWDLPNPGRTPPPPGTDIWSPTLETCSDLFT